MNLYFANAVREADRIAIEAVGIPSLALMERAASAVVRALALEVPDLLAQRPLVLCGKGNNGGDGLAVARLLRGAGHAPQVFLLGEPDRLSPDARVQYGRLMACGGSCQTLAASGLPHLRASLARTGLVVDCMLGTGLAGPVRGVYAKAIEAVNACGAMVAAVDIPSGLSGDALAPMGPAVEADLTLTLALPKPILFTPEAAHHCGEVRVLDIGIPEEATRGLTAAGEVLDEAWARQWFSPRGALEHKGGLGRLLVVAGSRGKSGAAVLAARGALRAGAGLVTVACPLSAQPIVAAALPEAMTLSLPETSEGTLSMDALVPIISALEAASAAGLGPGLGQAAETAALCRELFRRAALPMAVDADGLNAFAGREKDLSDHDGPRIFTPHPGEMGRLVGREAAEVVADRYALLPAKATEWDATVLLKGYRTLVAAPGLPWRMNLSGGPHMAGPGFGDVLTGVASALLARGMDPFDAAALAAWWHGAAADLASARLGGYGLLASEAADALPVIEGERRRP